MSCKQAEVPWRQQEIQVMGKTVLQPRLIAYMADSPRLSYTYSRTRQEALPWTPTVLQIKVPPNDAFIPTFMVHLEASMHSWSTRACPAQEAASRACESFREEGNKISFTLRYLQLCDVREVHA